MRMKIDYITNVSTTPNFSFETPTLSAGTWNFASPQGWTLSGHSGGVENVNDPTRFGNSNDFGTSPNKLNEQGGLGDQVAYVNLPSASNTGSATSDVIAIIEPNTTYQVTVAFGKTVIRSRIARRFHRAKRLLHRSRYLFHTLFLHDDNRIHRCHLHMDITSSR